MMTNNINEEILPEDTNHFEELKSNLKASKKSLKLIHVNVENITVHRDSFMQLFEDGFFDVIALSETFLKPEILSEPFNMADYNLVRHDRLDKEGGGVALYIRKIFKFKLLMTSQAKYCRKPEFMIVELSLGWKLLLAVVYKPPKVGFINEFFDIMFNLVPLYNDVIIIGDFNINLLADINTFEKNNFINMINSLGLCILPLGPTYHLPNSETWLDIILVNSVDKVKSSGQVAVSGISYHDLVYVDFNLKLRLSDSKVTKCIRDFKNINLVDLRAECANLQWDSVYLTESINDKVLNLSNMVIELYNKYVPKKDIRSSKNCSPWIDSHLRELMKQRDVLYKKYVKTKRCDDWEDYRVLRNRIKRIIRDSRNNYFKNLLSTDKSNKDIWKVLKSQGVGKQNVKMLEPEVDLNTLNQYFCGIDNTINEDLIGYYNTVNFVPDENNMFEFNNITPDDVLKALNSISSNAVGHDGIDIRFVKLIFNEVKFVLCHIFNCSLFCSEYPSQWKKCLILPLPKVKNAVECSNYRPINILCVLGKVFDKLVYQQMFSFVNERNILNMFQSGYRPHHSTQTALIKVIDDIKGAMDKRYITLLLLLDFSRAFDCVNHRLLLAILKSYNFSHTVINWFSSYLSNRLQCIKSSGGHFSEWNVNYLGVPQGSTLSALLFSLYINRINDSFNFCRSMMYADDMQMYIHCEPNKINEGIEMLNSDLVILLKWCKDHGLMLNISKCNPILLGTSRLLGTINQNHILPVVIDNNELVYKTSIVNLGLKMTSNLSWFDQVNHICNRVYKCLYQLRRLCFNPPTYIKQQMVMTLIFPLFDYAISAYCDLNDELTNQLQKAQNSCIRYIFNLNMFDHVTPYYKHLQWLKIRERRELNIMSTTFKILKYGEPFYLNNKYKSMRNVHLRETRFADQLLQFPIHRTVIYSKSFHVQSIRLINIISTDLKRIDSEKLFKKKLKEMLLLRYN